MLSRCGRCGTRVADAAGGAQIVFTCEGCGLPFLAGALLAHGDQRCADCTAGRMPPELPDREVSQAAENEVRAALSTRWRFVTGPALQSYLDRIARQVGARVEGAPAGLRVVLVDAAEHKALALPSGTLLVSTGLLAFLEDEAELAFVLGHEIAHAGCGEAAVRLVRLGFEATARERGASDGVSWSEAAVDLIRLGYGRKRERDADARSLDALLALDYDAASAIRYLRRLAEAGLRGETAVVESLIAHPTPADRIRRIERTLYTRVGVPADPRVNREVFRRAAGKAVLGSRLMRADLYAPEAPSWSAGGSRTKSFLTHRKALWAAAGLIAVGTVLLLLLR